MTTVIADARLRELYDDYCMASVLGDGFAAKREAFILALNARLEAADSCFKIMEQFLIEVSHAQEVGPWWFTKGEPALIQQVDLWVRKGRTALADYRRVTGESKHE